MPQIAYKGLRAREKDLDWCVTARENEDEAG
jgi:hypothetical protein